MTDKGMSSKVLNMKFMRQAEMKAEEKQQEEQERKLRDLSEWKTTSAEQLKAKLLAQKRKVQTVGFQTLNELRNGAGSPVVGRRTFGEEPKKAVETETKDNKSSNSQDNDDDTDLDQLWKRDNLSGNHGNNNNNKRTPSGSKRNFNGDNKKSSKKRKSQP